MITFTFTDCRREQFW